MKLLARNASRPGGAFTLVELLTVIAIVAVLATLAASALANAQRKARKTGCISNLHQAALAVEMYQDDFRGRPDTFRSMAEARMLTAKIVLCPEDRVITNWAGTIEAASSSMPLIAGKPELPHSYFRGFSLGNDAWERIQKSPFGGVAACQLHGIASGSRTEFPRLSSFQGLVLRALKDGSVIGRQLFWPSGSASLYGPSGADSAVTPSAAPELPLFVDENAP